MRFVPVIDATAIHALERVFKQAKNDKIKFILSGIQPEVYQELEKSGLLEEFGSENVCLVIEDALARAEELLTSDQTSMKE